MERAIAAGLKRQLPKAIEGVFMDPEMNMRFDVTANVNTLFALVGVIFFWRGIWTLWCASLPTILLSHRHHPVQSVLNRRRSNVNHVNCLDLFSCSLKCMRRQNEKSLALVGQALTAYMFHSKLHWMAPSILASLNFLEGAMKFEI